MTQMDEGRYAQMKDEEELQVKSPPSELLQVERWKRCRLIRNVYFIDLH